MSKKINELKSEKTDLVKQMEEIAERTASEERGKSSMETKIFETSKQAIKNIDERMAELEIQDEENKRNAKSHFVTINRDFKEWLNRAANGVNVEPFQIELRADPLVTTTQVGIVNKFVEPLDQLYSPVEQQLKSLGVKIYVNQKGNLSLPALTQSTAGWVSEGADSSTADLAPGAVTLQARRISIYQTLTEELIRQSNNIENDILNNLYDAIWRGISERFFDQLEANTAGQVTGMKAANGLTFTDVVNMEASLGHIDLARPAYVTTGKVKAYLKRNTKLANSQNSIWENDSVNEMPAVKIQGTNTDKIYYGDWSKMAIVSFGNGVEAIIDPFSYAKSGKLAITVSGYFDCGTVNPKAFVTLSDASVN